VKQLLTSVVREICTLRSVGAGERATAPGHPVAPGNWCPYRDRQVNWGKISCMPGMCARHHSQTTMSDLGFVCGFLHCSTNLGEHLHAFRSSDHGQ
ncbi:MAG: hypothetical protein WCA27_11775, partial [Candidatus Sulfotelmatobacter sp.]